MIWNDETCGIFVRRAICAAGAMLAVTGSCSSDEIFLHRFHGGGRGAYPTGIVAAPENGVLNKFIGTTISGGSGKAGTIFTIDRAGNMKILYSFNVVSKDGGYPLAPVVSDGKGGWYGTNGEGGTYPYGDVFRLDKHRNYSVLYSFAGGNDGESPSASLIKDGAGNLYGTTQFGGSKASCQQSFAGCGLVFKIAPDGTETVLWRFQGGSDGAVPLSELVRDAAGNLYGTTSEGGGHSDSFYQYGCGTVFKLTPQGQESILYAFKCGVDGADPEAGLLRDSRGNFYGTTYSEGCISFCIRGTVFKLTPDGEETVLYTFPENQGASPRATLTADPDGNLYGTTWQGGRGGSLFEITANGHEIDLHEFKGGKRDGAYPIGRLVLDGEGNLFGTTEQSGAGKNCINQITTCGMVFEFTAAELNAIRAKALMHRHAIPPSP